MDPQDAVRQLSLNTLSAMTNSAFGSIAAPVVDQELTDVLGIGGSNDLAGYMSKINAALNKIEHQLADLQASITSILAGITEIKEQINDVEVQAKLQAFSDNAGLVKELFVTYQDDIAGLTSSDASRRAAAITDLYGLLKTDNAVKIATAMTAAQEAFLPSLTEQKGLIEFQKSAVNDQMTAASRSYDGFIVLQDQRYPASPFTNAAGQYGSYSGFGLLSASQNAATTALDSIVLETFRAFVTVSIQGLTLLNAAWLNSIHEEQIKAQVVAIRKVLAAMVNFGAAIPAMVAGKPQAICKPMADAFPQTTLAILGIKTATGCPAILMGRIGFNGTQMAGRHGLPRRHGATIGLGTRSCGILQIELHIS